MITVDAAILALQAISANGGGSLVLVHGDCNSMHKVFHIDPCIIDDLEQHYVEEIHPDDNYDLRPANAVVFA